MSAGGVEFSSVPTKEQKPMEVRSGDVGNPLLVAPEDVETPTTLDAAPAPAPGGTLSRAVVALVRCMVGPAALYIPKGFSDAGIGGSLVCIVVANVLFALGISRLVDCWRHARDEGLDTAHGIQGLALCGNQPVERPVQQKLQTPLFRSNRSRSGWFLDGSFSLVGSF